MPAMKPSVALVLLLAALACPFAACVREDAPRPFWQLLMANPHGLYEAGEPAGGCSVPNGSTGCVTGSTEPTQCCADPDAQCYATLGPTICCKSLEGGDCIDSTDCCVGTCNTFAENPFCDFGGCFSRDTKVMTREAPEPVSLRDLRVGQHVLCYDSGPDMLVPGAPTWCPLKNFIRADDETVFSNHVSLTVRAVDGSDTVATSIVSWAHLLHLVTDPAPKQQAATAGELGAFVHDNAMNAKVGQLTPMATSPSLNTTVKLGVIERVEVVEGVGKYVLGVEHPFVWADSIIQPIWAFWFRPLPQGVAHGMTVPVDLTLSNAFRHMLHAPVWMSDIQPKGTPGRNAGWGDESGRAPLLNTLNAAFTGKGPLGVSGAGNFTRALEWFAPRYAAWKADPSKAITEADVLEVFPSLFSGAAPAAAAQGTPASCPAKAAAASCPVASQQPEQVFCYSRNGLRPLRPTATSA